MAKTLSTVARSPVTIEFSRDAIDKIEKHMMRQAPMLREKMLKTAFKESAEIFVSRVNKNVDLLKSRNLDRWERPEEHEFNLKDSIRTRTARSTQTSVGIIVDIHNLKGQPDVKQYATSVEYGHDMVVYGRRIEGRKVERSPFWRPAKSAMQKPIEMLVLRALRRLAKNDMRFKGK